MTNNAPNAPSSATQAPEPAPKPPRTTLQQLPAVISVLWILGILYGHGYTFDILLLIAIVAIIFFGRSVLERRGALSTRPLWLKPGESRVIASARNASILALASLATGTVVEFTAPTGSQEPLPFWMRIAWHGVCGFAIGYTSFLAKFKPMPTLRKRA
jgi:hypothetical protein